MSVHACVYIYYPNVVVQSSDFSFDTPIVVVMIW